MKFLCVPCDTPMKLQTVQPDPNAGITGVKWETGDGFSNGTFEVTVKGGTAAQGQAAQGRTMRSVLQTQSGFRFHFAKSAGAGGRWRLIFLDLRVSCSA